MSDTVIRAENLSKQYRLGAISGRRLRDDLSRWWARRRGRPDPLLKIGQKDHANIQGETLWALRDVSFEVKQGEVLGIIGRNGAGKSTLLKILSRITAPSSGEVKVKGRIGSLLEVGTGFHPELTGRENIYLNGAILGMTKADVARKFDEIVDFSGVEDFIDTPVKRYSSGMYVRLAFAVAAHLDPEILVMDEVLAVGDAEFQKKCLGKMEDVAHEGRTVVFVSHNMAAIGQLCQRGLLLDDGKVTFAGKARQAIGLYSRANRTFEAAIVYEINSSDPMRIEAISVITETGDPVRQIEIGRCFLTEIRYYVGRWEPGTYLALAITNDHGTNVLWSSDVSDFGGLLINRPDGHYMARVQIPGHVLSPGVYRCSVAIYAPGRQHAFDHKVNAVGFEIIDTTSLLARFGISHPAVTAIPLTWSTEMLT